MNELISQVKASAYSVPTDSIESDGYRGMGFHDIGIGRVAIEESVGNWVQLCT